MPVIVPKGLAANKALKAENIFVMDEAFSGLDADSRQRALTYIMEKKGSNPVLFLEHEADYLTFCRKVSII